MRRYRVPGAGPIAFMIIFALLAEASAWDKYPAGATAPPSNSTSNTPWDAPTPPPEAASFVDGAETAQARPGRFEVTVTEKGTILVDTANGQTWMLQPYKETLAWLPIERITSLDRLRELGAKTSVKEGVVREVELTDSTLGDADMEILGMLTSLEQLILNGCTNLTDAGLAPLQRLTNLTGLALERTNVTDAGLANLKDLGNLTYVSLNWTRTSDEGIRHLQRLTNLEVLYLCDTDVADVGLAALSQMQKLQWLDLRGTDVTDAGLRHLGKLPQLRLLSLYGIPMTDAGVPALTELANLEVLTLAHTQVTDAGLPSLARLFKLADLDLEGSQVTAEGVTQLQRMLPNCRVRFEAAPPPIVEIID